MKLMTITASLLLTTALMALSDDYRAYDTPVNYNYGMIAVGQTSLDDSDIDAVAVVGGGEAMINENIIFDVFYSGAIINEDSYDADTNSLSLGLSYRYGLTEKLDIVAGADVVYGWYNVEPIIGNDTSDNDFGYSLKSSLRYGFTRNFEGVLGVSYTDVFDDTATGINANISYYFSESFAFGGAYGQVMSDTDDSSTYTAFVKVRF